MKLDHVLNNPRCDPRMSKALIALVQRQGVVTSTAADLIDKDLGAACVSEAQLMQGIAGLQSLHLISYFRDGDALLRHVSTHPPI
jgi:hypothetical protein